MRVPSCAAVVVLAACTSSSTTPAPAPSIATPVTQADVDEHVEALRARLRKAGLSMQLRRHHSFIIAGNGTNADVDRGLDTVEWATKLFEQDLFDTRPSKLLDVFLFIDRRTYELGVRELTGSKPSTPYGFYSKAQGGMFMNIGTGGGTLVHELVHPYVEADFPNAPPWLNEGLGSLFEASAEEHGRIIGLINWRLRGLKQAITAGEVPSFERLTHLDTAAFYGDGSGVHYSQSRYLLYYLQEQGLLHVFYKTFRAARAEDPSGYKTLVATLGERDMAAFQQRWQRWVVELEDP